MRRPPGELIRLIRELHEEEPAMSYSAIARLLSVSRERVRVLWNRYGLSRPIDFSPRMKPRPRPLTVCDGCGISYERRTKRQTRRKFHDMQCFHDYRRHPDRLLKPAICKWCGSKVASPGRKGYNPDFCWACYGAHRTEIWELNKKKREAIGELTARATRTQESRY